MIDEANRMTVARVKALIEKYGVHLTHGQWVVSEADRDGYCPLGMYILEKLGSQEVTPEDQPDELCKDLIERGLTGKDFDVAFTGKIAELGGVTYAYAAGLNNGYETDNYCLPVETCNIHFLPLDFLLGFVDGRMLATEFPK